MQGSNPPGLAQRSDRDAERAELEREATRLIRAADRRERRRAVRRKPSSSPPPPPNRLTLADLDWLRKAGRVP